MSEKKKGFDLAVAIKRIKNVGRVFREIYIGFEKDIIPHHYLCGIALVIAIAFWRSHFSLFHIFPVASKIIVIPFMFIGYFAWGVWRVYLLNQFLANLTETFESAGVKTATGRLPSFISDRNVDNNCRAMTVNANRVTVKQFEAGKEKLEVGLFGFIDQFKEDRVHGVIQIYYSEEDFPPAIDLDSPYGKSNFSFVVGNTRSGEKRINLIDVPHLLVAGGSNSGKSTLLKQILATLYLNNVDAEFVLIDLKFGLESIEFRDLPKMAIFKTPQSALKELIGIQAELKERGDKLYANKCNNIIEYNRMAFAPRKDEKRPPEMLRRKIIFIDEAAQIFLASPEMTAADAAQARGVVATIAAQGRALGINIFIGTQRPDVNIVDGSIKANLQGRICFHMADNASSMTILDSVRAADLPDVKGRAIYRNGPELMEIQVPQISQETLKALFDPMRVKPKVDDKKEKEAQTTEAIGDDQLDKKQVDQ